MLREFGALLLVVAIACGGEAVDATQGTQASTSLPDVSSTTAAATRTTNAMATTTTDLPPPTTSTFVPHASDVCSDQPSTVIPDDASQLESITGDVDGDGFDDTVTGYVIGDAEARLHLELATGWGAEVRVDDPDLAGLDPLVSRPGRIVAMSGDHLVVAMVKLGLPGPVFGFFALRDCRLHPIALANGTLPDFWLGGSPAHDDWFSCNSSGVDMFRWVIEDFEAETRVYTAVNAHRYRYEPPSFVALDDVDPGLDFPVGADEARDIYPRCSD